MPLAAVVLEPGTFALATGVCSTRNTGLVASLGAGTVIDYTRDDFTRRPERYDVVVDNIANHPLSHCRRC